jgi:hypothetical protein
MAIRSRSDDLDFMKPEPLTSLRSSITSSDQTGLSMFRPWGVPRPTSKIVAACPSPDGLARDGTKGGKPRLVLSCTRVGALAVGVTSIREGERESPFVSPSSRATPPPRMRALALPFIDARRGSRCTMGV